MASEITRRDLIQRAAIGAGAGMAASMSRPAAAQSSSNYSNYFGDDDTFVVDPSILESACCYLYTDRFCSEVEPELLLGENKKLFIFVGDEFFIEVLGVMTANGWVRKGPDMSDEDFRKKYQ